MSRRNFILIFLAIDFVAVMIWALIVMLSGPRGSILNKMDKLADCVSMEEFKALDAIKDAQDFLKFFSDPVIVETKYGEFNATHDEESLKNHFMYGRNSCHSITLKFHNSLLDVVDKDNLTVTTDAKMTANLKQADPEVYEQKLIFHWKRDAGKWKIHKVVPYENPEDPSL